MRRPASARSPTNDSRRLIQQHQKQAFMAETFSATGRRKTSVAQVRISRGSGKIEVNGRPFEEYFPTAPLQSTVLKPFEGTKTTNAFDVQVRASGGGPRRQRLARQF